MKKLSILLVFLAFLVIGFFIGFNIETGLSWSKNTTLFFTILFSGAFGGMLYTARDSGLELPHRDSEKIHLINLGWVADCAFGIAGAFVVFLVVPTEVNITDSDSILGLIKLIALALVGGYGGRSLVDRALSNIAKKAEEAMESARESKEKLKQIQEIDTQAMELVSLQLDKDVENVDKQSLKETIKASSRAARYEIFKEARTVRASNWKNNKPLMERTIPIFEALIENEEGEKYHRNHAQLGYALKDKTEPDWDQAYKELTTAINLRNNEGANGFQWYEFNRAICGINLDKQPGAIQSDIEAAAKNPSMREKMKNSDLFKKWSDQNNFDLETLRIKDSD